jgi:GT2 family glycosyltransferase
MSKVSIIILAFNGISLTLDVLNDLVKLDLTGINAEAIVVDNASTDDTVARLKDFRLPNMPFRLLENKVNLGFAGGNNVGIDVAVKEGADYVLLLNNDVILPKDVAKVMVATADQDKRIGAVAPKMYFAKGYEFHKDKYKNNDLGKVIWYAGGILNINNVYSEHRGVDEVDRGQYDRQEETDFANGACVLLRAKALKEVGYLKENYFLYWEDVELSQRMKSAGWKIIYTPKTFLWHKVSVAAGGPGGETNDYFLSRNRLAFGMQYRSLRTKLALLKDSLRLLIKGRKWQKMGVLDFYLGRMGKGSRIK